jgi:hypothetical protein
VEMEFPELQAGGSVTTQVAALLMVLLY